MFATAHINQICAIYCTDLIYNQWQIYIMSHGAHYVHADVHAHKTYISRRTPCFQKHHGMPRAASHRIVISSAFLALPTYTVPWYCIRG